MEVGEQLRRLDALERFKKGECAAAGALTFGVLAGSGEKVAERLERELGDEQFLRIKITLASGLITWDHL